MRETSPMKRGLRLGLIATDKTAKLLSERDFPDEEGTGQVTGNR